MPSDAKWNETQWSGCTLYHPHGLSIISLSRARLNKNGSSKKSQVLVSTTTYSSKSMSCCSICGNATCSNDHVLSTIKSMSLCKSSLDNSFSDDFKDDMSLNNESQVSQPQNSTLIDEDFNVELKDIIPQDLSAIMGEQRLRNHCGRVGCFWVTLNAFVLKQGQVQSPWYESEFYLQVNQNSFSYAAATQGCSENLICSHPRTGDATVKKSQKKSEAIQWAGFFATMYKLLVSPVQRWLHMRLPYRQLAIWHFWKMHHLCKQKNACVATTLWKTVHMASLWNRG